MREGHVAHELLLCISLADTLRGLGWRCAQEQGVPIVIQHNAAGPVLISNGANGYAGSNGTNGHSVTSGSETASQNVVPSAI